MGRHGQLNLTSECRLSRRIPVNERATTRVKTGLAEMLKGGVIMDVTNAEQASVAEEAGGCAVMPLERVPADLRASGGVARMADPEKIAEIQETFSVPVMAKARIGHFAEAQILDALEVDLSLIHISEPTRLRRISYAVFCLKKKKNT